MTDTTPEVHYDMAEIEKRARKLRAEAMAHGIATVRAWVAARVANVTHRGATAH